LERSETLTTSVAYYPVKPASLKLRALGEMPMRTFKIVFIDQKFKRNEMSNNRLVILVFSFEKAN
jgi:hypothetical protein